MSDREGRPIWPAFALIGAVILVGLLAGVAAFALREASW